MKDNLKRNSKDTPPRKIGAAFRLSKNLPSRKFRREEKRQNCKIMLQNLVLQFGKQLDEKAQRDFFDKLKLPEACASGIFLRRKREMAPMGNAAAFPEHLAEGNSTAQVHWCTAHSPDVSLRGAKRRGNLAEHGRTTGKPSAKSQLPSRDCHVGLRPPRNDKFGG